MNAFEVNFDGLVGPTHNYGGLSYGNVASTKSKQQTSSPRQAALQGLAKMKTLHDMGFKQAVIPPHERPALNVLRRIGFTGSDQAILAQVAKANPVLLNLVSSASCMWTANAATVSPSADTADGKVHFTVANLVANFHRSIEPDQTAAILRAIFADETAFSVHDALPSVLHFGDEGAANHTRFCAAYGDPGVEFFVYGQSAFCADSPKPARYPARQTLEAAEAVARMHGLSSDHVVYAQQNPEVIDAGVFHNDVISVGNRNAIFYHEQAFLETPRVLDELDQKLKGADLVRLMVPEAEVSVADAVSSYLFNSQLLSKPDGTMMLVVPHECEEVGSVKAYLDALLAGNNPVSEVRVFDLKQSMKNGGGPACLRLRVALNEHELSKVNPSVIMSDALYATLVDWVNRHYRDELSQVDLADPQLLMESRAALHELTNILNLGAIYPFQR